MLEINSIEKGIVIDHITAGHGITVFNHLHLDRADYNVALIMNAYSEKMGKKDIIKIDADIPVNLDIIGYVDPGITVNVIKNGEIIDKKSIDTPQTLKNVIKCKNPRCITSVEQELDHVFTLVDKENKIYKCIYCETKAN